MGAFTPDSLLHGVAHVWSHEELCVMYKVAVSRGDPAMLYLHALQHQHGMAADLAASDISNTDLVDFARAFERAGRRGAAWVHREAVAIRIVDYPNEKRQEVDDGGVVQG